MNEEKNIIGRKDKADFPELKIFNIDVKIDTGAFTSAFHCYDIEEIIQDNRKVLKFRLLDPSHPKFKDKDYYAVNYTQKNIKNTTGIPEYRYIIQTKIRLFGKEMPIEVSLAQRGEMKFPVLIGRKLLNGNFIVDSSRLNLSYRYKKKLAEIKRKQ